MTGEQGRIEGSGLILPQSRERQDGIGGLERFDDLVLINSSDEAIGEGMDLNPGFAPGDTVAGRRQLVESAVEGETVVVGDDSGFLVTEEAIKVE